MSNRFVSIPNVPINSQLSQQITVNVLGTQNMQQVSAKGNGFTHDGDTVASFDDYVKLITDVQTLANDLNYTRETLNVLIKQIKGN